MCVLFLLSKVSFVFEASKPFCEIYNKEVSDFANNWFRFQDFYVRYIPPFLPASQADKVLYLWVLDLLLILFSDVTAPPQYKLFLHCPASEEFHKIVLKYFFKVNRVPTFSSHEIPWLFQYFCHFSLTFFSRLENANYIYLWVQMRLLFQAKTAWRQLKYIKMLCLPL